MQHEKTPNPNDVAPSNVQAEGHATEINPLRKGTVMFETTMLPPTTDKDWNGFTAADQHAKDEADAQAWFDARPRPERVLVSSVLHDNREAVWTMIFERFDEMNNIACAKRAEKRRNTTVANSAGYVIDPDSILMRSICNGDNAADFGQRARYFVNVGA